MFDITKKLKKDTSQIGIHWSMFLTILVKKEICSFRNTYFDYCDGFPREMVASIYEKCNNPYRNFVPKKNQQKLKRCFGTSIMFEAY